MKLKKKIKKKDKINKINSNKKIKTKLNTKKNDGIPLYFGRPAQNLRRREKVWRRRKKFH
jgi:hypothetical protein